MTDIRFDEAGDRVLLRAGDAVLAEYVARPDHPTYESPRPYFSPIRTFSGELVSLYRPHDHVWHKGIAWSLPVVGDPMGIGRSVVFVRRVAKPSSHTPSSSTDAASARSSSKIDSPACVIHSRRSTTRAVPVAGPTRPAASVAWSRSNAT